jgi:hypothetical protein
MNQFGPNLKKYIYECMPSNILHLQSDVALMIECHITLFFVFFLNYFLVKKIIVLVFLNLVTLDYHIIFDFVLELGRDVAVMSLFMLRFLVVFVCLIFRFA